MQYQIIERAAAIAGRKSSKAPIVNIADTVSAADLMVCACSSFMSAVPRTQGFIDTAVRIFSRLGAGELLFHAFHAGTE